MDPATAAADALERLAEAATRCTPEQRLVVESVMKRHPEMGFLEALAWAEGDGTGGITRTPPG